MSTSQSREAQLRSALESTSFALACVTQANLQLINAESAPPATTALAADIAGTLDTLNPCVDVATPPARGVIIGSPDFVLSGSVVVIDRTNALMWDVRTLGEMTFAEAEKAISKLNAENYAGLNDWRLPSRMELESILDLTRHDPAIDTSFFPDTKSGYYWSSTPAAYSPADYAWVVDFCYGNSNWDNRGDRLDVRAVRSVPRVSQ